MEGKSAVMMQKGKAIWIGAIKQKREKIRSDSFPLHVPAAVAAWFVPSYC